MKNSDKAFNMLKIIANEAKANGLDIMIWSIGNKRVEEKDIFGTDDFFPSKYIYYYNENMQAFVGKIENKCVIEDEDSPISKHYAKYGLGLSKFLFSHNRNREESATVKDYTDFIQILFDAPVINTLATHYDTRVKPFIEGASRGFMEKLVYQQM